MTFFHYSFSQLFFCQNNQIQLDKWMGLCMPTPDYQCIMPTFGRHYSRQYSIGVLRAETWLAIRKLTRLMLFFYILVNVPRLAYTMGPR